MANIAVNYETMRTAGRQLTGIQAQIEDQLKQAQSLISSLVADGFVTDAASKAFDDEFTHFHHGASETMQALTGMNNYLNAAADKMHETDQALSQGLGSH